MSDKRDRATVRPWHRADLAAAHSLTNDARWPHRLEDWHFAFRLGIGFVAVVDNRVVGVAVCFHHGPGHATVGLIIVSPDVQGRGIGRLLTEAALEAAGDRSVLLNATEAGRPLYERLGFRTFGEIRQHQGIVPALPAAAPSADVVRAVGDEGHLLVSLDETATGLQRTELLRALRSDGRAVVLERANRAAGYAIVRDFGRGRVIGPVVAPDVAGATRLIERLLAEHGGDFVRLDVPVDSGLPAWLAARGLVNVGPATSMVRGRLPAPAGPARLFALVSQAIG